MELFFLIFQVLHDFQSLWEPWYILYRKIIYIGNYMYVFQGSDPCCLNKHGIPALHIAAKNKRADCIAVLVDSGAEPDKKGPTAM